MCGIAGFVAHGPGTDDPADLLRRMLARLTHRGPDDEGRWFDGPVALGHRRLAIVDLSPLGHQPMASPSGRHMIVFNGEIYNHAALRAKLHAQGVAFRGHSDTEVLAALIERDGVPAALARCIGMFALAVWDRRDRVLTLARDRFGEKPLYHGRAGRRLMFASDVAAITVVPGFHRGVDPETVRDIVQRGHAMADRSIYRDLRQVAPGTCVAFAEDGDPRGVVTRFHDLDAVLVQGRDRPFAGSFDDAVDEVERLLGEAVALQLQADVPVGAFLSGGVDSSIVTALMVRHSPTVVRSYSIGFERDTHDEAPHARAVAAHLGTRHTEFYVDETQARDLVPTLASIYAEPLADSSQIPTLVLSRLVRRDVTVALSGDGADEVFGGYPKYRRGQLLSSMRARRLAHAMAAVAGAAVPVLRSALPAKLADRVPWHQVHTAAQLYGAGSPLELADRLSTLNRDALPFLAPSLRHGLQPVPPAPPSIALPYRREAMRLDLHRYLPGDILCKVDRATMAASLESRAPMLDHRLFAFSASLPDDHLFDSDAGKRVLRALLFRLLPRELVDRPKSGFQAPLADWLRSGLLEWAQDALSSRAAAELLDVDAGRRLLALHRVGPHDLSARVWPIVTLAAWAQRHLGPHAEAAAPAALLHA